MLQVLCSGLIAGIIAGLVNLLATHWNNKTQKETIRMETAEKQKEVTLEWSNELLKLVGQFLECCFKINGISKAVAKSGSKVKEKQQAIDLIKQSPSPFDDAQAVLNGIQNSLNDAQKELDEKKDNILEVFKEMQHLQVMIRLYLFADDVYTNDVLDQLRTILQEGRTYNRVSAASEDKLVEVTKNYIRHAWSK